MSIWVYCICVIWTWLLFHFCAHDKPLPKVEKERWPIWSRKGRKYTTKPVGYDIGNLNLMYKDCISCSGPGLEPYDIWLRY